MAGIKETLDVVAAAQSIATAVQKSLADGKFKLIDGRFFIPVVGAVKEAVKGADLIVLELKDLSADEATQLLTACWEVVQGFVGGVAPILHVEEEAA